MLMTVLKGPLAVKQSKALIRTFKKMKDYILENRDLIGQREILQLSMEAGYSKLKIQKCKLDEWITNIVKDFTEEARQKGICIKLQMTTDIEEVWFDKQKCHTVLSNLLMNALKFSMPESCITINTRKLENKVRISVVDEGIGIQDSDITNLFTRFYKGNHKEKGSGFGLYYAYVNGCKVGCQINVSSVNNNKR